VAHPHNVDCSHLLSPELIYLDAHLLPVLATRTLLIKLWMRAFGMHAPVPSHLKSRALSRADHGSSPWQRFMVRSPKPRTLVSWCTFTFLQLKFCEETVNVSFWYACSSLFTPQEQSIVILSIAQQAKCRTVVFPDNHRTLCYAWTVWVIPISPIPSSHWDKSLCANQYAKTLLKKIESQDCTIEALFRPVSAAAKPKIHQASSLWYVPCQIQTSTEKKILNTKQRVD